MRPVLFAHLRVLLVCYLTRTVCQSVSHSLLVSEFARGRLIEVVFQIPAGYDGAAAVHGFRLSHSQAVRGR